MGKRVLDTSSMSNIKSQVVLIQKKINRSRVKRINGILKITDLMNWAKWARFGAKRAERMKDELSAALKSRYSDCNTCSKRLEDQLRSGRMEVPRRLVEAYPEIKRSIKMGEDFTFNPFSHKLDHTHEFLKLKHSQAYWRIKGNQIELERLNTKQESLKGYLACNQENVPTENQDMQHVGLETEEDIRALKSSYHFDNIQMQELRLHDLDRKNVYEELNVISFEQIEN